MKSSLGSRIKAANAALITRGEMDAVAEYFTADYVVRLTAGQDATGHAAIRGALKLLRSAFPEVEVEIEILVEHGDRVAWQRTFRGVQRGAFHGFPASGREVAWRELVTSRFRDGLIAEEWLVSDLAERLLRSRKTTGAQPKPARRAREAD